MASLHATAGARLAEKFNVPHIVELNAPLAVEQAAYRATGFGDLAARAERWTLTRADAVIVVSEELRRHAISLGVKRGRIHVMPNGVNPELFFPAKGRARHSVRAGALRKKDGANGVPGPTLGFVGGLRPWHGVEILPELLARLSERHPGARLVIVGDGPLRGELEREFRKRGLQRRVTITGALPHERVPALIQRLDLALAPYPRVNHPFYFSPLKLFEYMACGVAVVAADLGQVGEIVQSGKTGLLYPAGNLKALTMACERLAANPELRQKLGGAAARLVHQRFTWDHNAARVVKLAGALKRRRRSRP